MDRKYHKELFAAIQQLNESLGHPTVTVCDGNFDIAIIKYAADYINQRLNNATTNTEISR